MGGQGSIEWIFCDPLVCLGALMHNLRVEKIKGLRQGDSEQFLPDSALNSKNVGRR